MPIEWDAVGEHYFETGIDRGVLYSPNDPVMFNISEGSYEEGPGGYAWNGLISVDDTTEGLVVSSLYFDGIKTLDLVKPGDFSASLKAYTYPDKFLQYDGFSEVSAGLLIDNQPRNVFHLSYRTKVGNELNQKDLGYKIHLLYNLTATPDAKAFKTVDTNISPTNFGWNLTSKPERILGRRPTSHFIIDSTKIDSGVLASLEDILYGYSDSPRMPTVLEIMTLTGITIIDLEDGRWTATGPDYLFEMLDDHTFEIDGVRLISSEYGSYTIGSSY